ncbi:metal-dependent hydrolase [Paenibacillus sp. HN-1]|uniref:metal-dependent hydrolase n=1 Tax=Paenibacillus TaxID=44249 RepID=UPI001CA91F12|nr:MULTISPECIES: metal-dependent hydrolase [Paenibacillus]MBY9080017.1 metal-dependent hydrolase [Paenibacillus sp. CGMCC 1.18879]MBY9086715.1 metal-dependent hydrolase [Paenibacillus sinensis]
MNILYLGHSCFLIESAGVRVIIDPFISGNPNAPIKKEDIVDLTAVLVTHGHADHTGDCIEIAAANRCPIITSYELAVQLAQKGAEVHPMGIGGAYDFEWGRVKLTPAWHGAGIELEGNAFNYGGIAAGMLLTMRDTTIYHAGDTALFGDMKLIGELNPIDIAMLPIGDNFTMGIEDSVIAAGWLGAKLTIPMHYNTFPLIAQDPSKWSERMAKQQLKGQVLKAGESFNTVTYA